MEVKKIVVRLKQSYDLLEKPFNDRKTFLAGMTYSSCSKLILSLITQGSSFLTSFTVVISKNHKKNYVEEKPA